MRIVKIQNVGNVAFPDSMTDEDMNQAAGQLHEQANPVQSPAAQLSSVMEYVAGHRNAEQSTSEHLKSLAQIARVLEENPALAKLAIAGLQTLPASNRP